MWRRPTPPFPSGTPPRDIASAEAILIELRTRPAATEAAFRAALACAVPHDPAPCILPAVLRAGLAVLGAAHPEHAYHDRHHVAETMLAAGWLCAAGGICQTEAALAVLAMAGHDLAHDGSRCLDGRLETHAAAVTQAACRAAGLHEGSCVLVGRLIRATAPDRPAACGDGLFAIVRDADVFASLLPRLGWRLAFALRREWRRAREPAAEHVTSFAGRHSFLSRYRPRSAAATRLGLTQTAARQLGTLECVGAARLDALPRARAVRAYRAALAA